MRMFAVATVITRSPKPSAALRRLAGPPLPVQNYSAQTFTSPNPNDAPNKITTLTPLKTSQVDPTKVICSDTIDAISDILHKTGSNPNGVNVLFADSHVRFVPIRGNNLNKSYEPFDPNLWGSAGLGASGARPRWMPTELSITPSNPEAVAVSSDRVRPDAG